jgi:hypothetical protein
MEQERHYLDVLADVTDYRVAGSQLWLLTEDGQALAFAAPDVHR